MAADALRGLVGGLSWMVLDKAADGRKKLLLCKEDFWQSWLPEDYDWSAPSGGEGFVWEVSGARAYLNGQFIEEYFSDEEKARICEVSIENKGNPFGDQHDCPATADRVFALSLEESVRYFAANPDVENY